jgi:hypothetical protein
MAQASRAGYPAEAAQDGILLGQLDAAGKSLDHGVAEGGCSRHSA